jgi:hypothetical protein
MPMYRFCMLDPTGVTVDYRVRNCLTDENACEDARHFLAEFSRIEVWDSTRMVGQLMPRPGADAAV